MRIESRADAERFSRQLMSNWGIDLPHELPGGFCSYVATDYVKVLKVPFQGEEQTSGLLASRRLAGIVGPAIHWGDKETGSVLMDFVRGDSLASWGADDDLTLPVFTDLAQRIQEVDPTGLPDLATYYVCPSDLIEHLLATTERKVFLHADLHHLNIIGTAPHWQAIDPKGFYGDPTFETVAYLRNPIDALATIQNMEDFLEARIHKVAHALNLDPNRIWAWSLADRRENSPTEISAWARMLIALENLSDRFSL